ncbi:MAG: MBL fold metallo-hydrolase [Parcubacteria group bacterium]|nr:MBL fold metallo-hydrolase [Parcubacteria group bacterium]
MDTHQYRSLQTILVCFFLFALSIGNLIVWRDIWQGPSFLIAFFDVKQGDSIFMRSPWGHTVLIDGGPDTQVQEKVGRMLLPWEKRIDLVILSHPDKDHIFGLIGILQRFQADTVYWTGVRRKTAEYAAWELELAEHNVVLARAPQRISWTQNQSQHLDILSPVQDYAGRMMDMSNESGIVARLVLPKHSILLTADIPASVEMDLVKIGAQLASDILKVAHHGSKNSSASGFLQAVGPSVAIISSGKENTYGHPHQETLAKLEQYGIQIRRTDQEGDIRFYLR